MSQPPKFSQPSRRPTVWHCRLKPRHLHQEIMELDKKTLGWLWGKTVKYMEKGKYAMGVEELWIGITIELDQDIMEIWKKTTVRWTPKL